MGKLFFHKGSSWLKMVQITFAEIKKDSNALRVVDELFHIKAKRQDERYRFSRASSLNKRRCEVYISIHISQTDP